MVRFRFPCAAVILTVLTASCSAGAAGTKQAKPMSLEQLANGTGCKVQPQKGAAELEQGLCETGAGKYVLMAFSSDEATESWLTEAKPWGGHYLQGPRWVIVGTGAQLQTFQKKVGGTLIEGEDHSAGGHAGHGS